MKKALITALALFPAAFLAFVIGQYAVDLPWFDDFEAFPQLIREEAQTSKFWEQLQLVLRPQNEHRAVFSKLLTVLYYEATGRLDFVFLYWAGFVFTLATCYLFFRAFQDNHLPLLYFLPVSFLLFQVQYHLTFLWAVCGLQHQPVVFFVCLTMYLLAKQRFGWAILAGFCANFAMSNGIFVWVGGAAILLYQRQFRWLGFWIVAATTGIWLYFSGMSAQGNENSFAYFKQHPDETFFGFFAFLGGLFDFIPERSIRFRTALPIGAGILLVVAAVLWLWKITKNWFAESPKTSSNVLLLFALGVMGFLFSNAAVIALLRPRFGFFVMVVSNYKIYPALFMAVVYAAWLSVGYVTQKERIFKIGLGLAVYVWGLSLVHYLPAIAERRKSLLVHAYNQENHGFGLGFVPKSPAALYTDTLMREMKQKNIFQYPTDFEGLYQKIRITNGGVCPITPKLQITEKEINLNAETPDYPRGFNDGIFVFLRSSTQLYIFKMEPHYNQSRNFFRTFGDGITFSIPRAAIEKGRYELGFAEVRGELTRTGVCEMIDL